MIRRYNLFYLCIVIFVESSCASTSHLNAYVQTSCQAVTGENIQLSDKVYGIYETQISVNPLDGKQLIASAIEASKPNQHVVSYVSLDSGKTWSETSFETNQLDRTGDPVVGYGQGAIGYYFYMHSANFPSQLAQTYVRQSYDFGRSWSEPVLTDAGDHGQFAADNMDNSPYLGAVYYFSKGAKRLVLILSRDNGKSWRFHEVVSHESLSLRADEGLQTEYNVLVNKIGELILPFVVFDRDSTSHWITLSKDGGETFESPYEIHYDGASLIPPTTPWVAYAIDASSSAQMGRIYAAWAGSPDSDAYLPLLISHSDNGGQTWRDPTILDLNSYPERTGGGAHSVLPALAVNGHGDLLVAWYHGELNADGRTLQISRYWTASFDGGLTFQNVKPLSDTFKLVGRLGDYLNIAVGPDGKFHHIWMDGRTGKQQMWYANIEVLCDGKPAKAHLPDVKAAVN